MMSRGSQTRPAISRRLSSTTPTTPSSSAAATPSIPSSSVVGTATPSSSAQAQAQHTPHEAQVEGTDHVLIDDDVPVGGKRKLKSDVWLEFEDVIVGGKKKLNASGVKSFLFQVVALVQLICVVTLNLPI
jgi:hypothetical protein